MESGIFSKRSKVFENMKEMKKATEKQVGCCQTNVNQSNWTYGKTLVIRQMQEKQLRKIYICVVIWIGVG